MSFSASFTDGLVTGDGDVQPINPFTTQFSTEYGFGFASAAAQQAALSETAATSDTVLPGSGVVGFLSSLAETAATSDSLTPVLGYNLSLAETAATASSQTFVAISLTLPTDTASSTDGVTSGAGIFAATLSDSTATAGTFSNITVRSLSDSTVTADGVTEVSMVASATLSSDSAASSGQPVFPVRAFTSGFSSGFGDSPAPFATASLSETAAGSELYTFSGTFTLTDTAATGESLLLTKIGLLLSETASSSESLTSAATTTATLSGNTAVSSDSVTLTASGLPLSDSAVSSDLLVYPGGAFAAVTLSETAAATDVVSVPSANYSLSLNETAVVTSESLSFISGFALARNETAATSDTVAATTMVATATVAETAATSEALVGNGVATATLGSETASSSDSATITGWGTTLLDSTAGSDTVSAAGVGATAQTATAATSEILTSLQGYVISLAESAATSDARTPTLAITPAALADSATTTESLTAGTMATTASLSDSFSAVDEYHLIIYLASVADSLVTSDTRTAVANSLPVLADSVATGDAYSALTLLDTVQTGETVSQITAGFAGFIDALLSGDILVAALGYQNSYSDTVATADSLTLLNSGYALPLADMLVLSEAWVSGGIGSPLIVMATVVPTGGTVLLQFPSYFPTLPNAVSLTIRRSVDGSGIWTTIYQGPPVGVFLDVGDGMPKPLDANLSYIWQAEDYSGTAFIGPLRPVSSLINAPDQLTQVLIRALQGAINSMVLPAGMQRPQITIRMPTNGWQAMPFIVVNVDLIQQTEVEIGEDIVNPTPDNNWTLFANAKRVWRVTIMSQDAEERDFYRDSLLAVFRVLKATAFAPIGLDVSHTFQAVSYSSAQEWEGVAPGFYAADLLLEINGIFPAAVLTNYPVILRIESNPTWLLDTFTETLGPLDLGATP